ncbi:hypothetical protein HAX54_029684 [Datura stramonium]|uniref:Uncharacterized protein n=1 Tax=Datura stramonium TaxID=4076 RepID=A0ABS8V8N6_DATST|nr:hypothetical protein [Datura stramonium]
MELDHSSTKQDAFCTIPKDYLQDFHHLDITFSLAEGPSTFNTNPDHMNFTIEMNNDYDLLFDQFFSNEVVNCSPIDQDFNFDNYHEFKSFEQNGGGGSGSTQVVTKNFESSMDMNYNFSNCDHDLKPIINFNVVPDESSCITSTVDNIYDDKEIDERKNKKSLSSSSMRRLEKSTRKKSKSAKSQWTIEEDRILINLVEKFGDRKWSQIAEMLKGRIGKQCRERWHNHLRPDIKKELWTEEEDRILIEAHAEIGNKWAEIAKRLAGRTENSIKNHWNATKRRQLTKRKCRTKWPSPSSLLLNYIKSFNIENGNINAAKVVEPVDQVPADFSGTQTV